MSLAPIVVKMRVQSRQNTVPMQVSGSRTTVNMSTSSSINPHVNGDYNILINKPQINGIELVGDKTSAELGIDLTYTHTQNVASAEWIIRHDLHKYPSVTVVDSAGTVVIGEVQYLSADEIKIIFTGAFSGKAYLN